jgi:predicted TIM-barrel fold metal-dependent hydrolase
MKKIDAHAHVGFFGSWCNVGVTSDAMVKAMSAFDIEKSIVSYPDNSVTLAAIKKYPEKLKGIAWLDPNQGEKAVSEFERLIEQGFVGLKLHPLFNAYVADDAVVHPLIEVARARALPVFIHSGHAPFSLPWSIGQLASQFPDVRMVMVHMGHGHGVYIQAAIEVAVKHENIWLENSGMPMHTKIKEAYERVGKERLFWGSDIPFHHYAVEILRTEVSGLAEGQLEDVFYNNINKFMGW